jgi:hypothetical protein
MVFFGPVNRFKARTEGRNSTSHLTFDGSDEPNQPPKSNPKLRKGLRGRREKEGGREENQSKGKKINLKRSKKKEKKKKKIERERKRKTKRGK